MRGKGITFLKWNHFVMRRENYVCFAPASLRIWRRRACRNETTYKFMGANERSREECVLHLSTLLGVRFERKHVHTYVHTSCAPTAQWTGLHTLRTNLFAMVKSPTSGWLLAFFLQIHTAAPFLPWRERKYAP